MLPGTFSIGGLYMTPHSFAVGCVCVCVFHFLVFWGGVLGATFEPNLQRQRRKEEIEMQKLKDKLNSLLAGGSSSRGSTRGAAAPNIIIPSLLPDNMVSSARRKHGMESQVAWVFLCSLLTCAVNYQALRQKN